MSEKILKLVSNHNNLITEVVNKYNNAEVEGFAKIGLAEAALEFANDTENFEEKALGKIHRSVEIALNEIEMISNRVEAERNEIKENFISIYKRYS